MLDHRSTATAPNPHPALSRSTGRGEGLSVPSAHRDFAAAARILFSAVPLFLIIILGSMLLGDVAFWLWGDRKLRRTKHPKVWRPLLGLWVGVLLGYLLWFLLLPQQA